MADTTPSVEHGGGRVTYGKSWADDIQKYHAAKATLPWRPEQQTPVKHVTRYEKSREEREYDLMLGKFRDAEREIRLQKQETEKRDRDLEHSRAKQLRTVDRFNLINFAPAYEGAKDPKAANPSADRPIRRTSNVDYNIVTNIDKPGASAPSAQARSPSRRPMRDFSILTNKYHSQHDDRTVQELQRAKEIASVKFYKSHNFDPVRIAFFDEHKEAKFLEERDKEQKTHGKDRVFKLPPREQFSEGRLYNIINQDVINARHIATYEGHAARATNKMQKVAFERRMHEFGEQLLEREEDRCLNRFSHARHSQSYAHGYDPITNQPFDGIDSKQRAPTRTHETLPVWEILETGVPSTNRITAKAGASKGGLVTIANQVTSELPNQSNHSHGRPNVFLVDHSATQPEQTSTSYKGPASSVETIRTGGFGH